MGGAVCEAHHFVFDGWAVARSNALDLARIHRRASQVGADDCVGGRARRSYAALDLGRLNALGKEREGRRRIITGLHGKAWPVDRAAVEPGRSARFQPTKAQIEPHKPFGEPMAWGFAKTTGRG